MSNLAPVAPGAYVTSSSATPNPSGLSRTGNWFVTGECAMGPVGVPIPVYSLAQYVQYCGGRTGFATLYDSLNEYFADGGLIAYVSRVSHSSAVAATVSLSDTGGTPQPTLSITANGPGAAGNSYGVIVAAGTVSNSYTLTITLSGAVVAQSPNLFNPTDAVSWASTLAPWTFPVVIANLASTSVAPANNPATGTFVLSSGADATGSIVEADWTSALAVFASGLSAGLPGQVAAPGHSTTPGYQALLAHAFAFNRFALLDDADSATASALLTDVANALAGATPGSTGYGVMLGPWVQIPGIPAVAGGSPQAALRTVPPSALVAALCARNDQTNNCNIAPAGPNGQSTYAIGVTQTYTAAALAALNSGGFSVIQQLGGVVQLYGNVTIGQTQLANQRMIMQITDTLMQIDQEFVFVEIDAQGHTLSAYEGALTGPLLSWWTQGALFGATPAAAFNVDVAAPVNTPTTAAAQSMYATVNINLSPTASFVYTSIVNNPITQQLPA